MPLPATALLNVWERGQSQLPVQRALLLLQAAYPETAPERLAEFSIGRRDGELLTLHEQWFGPQFTALAACPQCRESVELHFVAGDIRIPSTIPVEEPLTLCREGVLLHFRLPNSGDLITLAGLETSEQVRRLLERCILSAERQGIPVAVDDLPEPVCEAVMDRMAEIDPQADVQLMLACPACNTAWQESFDIASFLWIELDAWARQTLSEVHRLASAYGWSETDILTMSPLRRQFYLEMLDS